jgi:hypothetical protein
MSAAQVRRLDPTGILAQDDPTRRMWMWFICGAVPPVLEAELIRSGGTPDRAQC